MVRAVEDATPILVDYLDVGGRPTVREVESHHVVLGSERFLRHGLVPVTQR
jgi:hypothetical protein